MVRDLFRNKDMTEFVIATIPTMLGINESARLLKALRKEDIPCRRIIVNQGDMTGHIFACMPAGLHALMFSWSQGHHIERASWLHTVSGYAALLMARLLLTPGQSFAANLSHCRQLCQVDASGYHGG